MYEIGCVIIAVVDVLEVLIRKVLPRYHARYRARCFFRGWDDLRIAGDAEWNCQVLELLMSDYGYI